MGEPAEPMSWSEYVALDDAAAERHEFVAGRVYAMASATPRHNRIVGNTFAALDRALRGKPCIALAGAQRVYVAATQLGAYPDVTVVCGKPEHGPDGRTVVNPTLLVEVLSPSTEDYDRGAKLRHYMRLASFVEYLVVGSEEQRVEHHRRLESGQWLMTTYEQPDDAIALPVLDAAVRLGDLYDRVDEL
jgi:Uma2 family endonuclease